MLRDIIGEAKAIRIIINGSNDDHILVTIIIVVIIRKLKYIIV